MEPRKKPIPNPLPRAKAVRGLVAATGSRALPTVAALLAATSMLACSGESPDIAADQQVMRATLQVAPASPAQAIDPLPGMGALEANVELPPPPPPKPVIKPPVAPIAPSGGPKAIAPIPKPPVVAGKIA
ncbi:MAG: hypothetical protein ACXVCJ_28965, partial [Polyangiales bacterium]